MTEVAQKVLPSALSSALSRAFPETDQSLWFIRRLDLSLDINASWNRDELARCLAARTARAIGAEMGTSGDGRNILRFDNPAEYLAAFLADLAEGHAWGRWYYGAFDGLRLLPVSAALRTAICADAATASAAFHLLESRSVRQIILQLTDADVGTILQTMAEQATATSAGDGHEAITVALETMSRSLLRELSQERASLLLFVEASRGADSAGDHQFAQLCQAVVGFIRCIEQTTTLKRSRLFSALKNRDPALLYGSVGSADGERLVPLLRLTDGARSRIIDAIGEKPHVVISDESGSPVVQTTAFGGFFFLLPLIDELPITEAAHGLPDAQGVSLRAIIRWLVLVKCIGQSRAAAAARDPVLREFAGVPEGISFRELVAHGESRITTKKLGRLLLEVAQHRRRNGSVGAVVGVLARVQTAGKQLAVMVDATRGCWLFSVHSPQDGNKALASALKRMPFSPDIFLCDEIYRSLVRKVFPGTAAVGLDDLEATEACGHAKIIKPVLAGLGRLEEEVGYFALPQEFGLSPQFDRALGVVAQGLMRDFAWRLPGFAWSGPAYLYENFLDCQAKVEEEALRHVVTLGRSPLHLVLNMTGISRRHYELSWSRGQRIELYGEHV